jgi:hypothetical protein
MVVIVKKSFFLRHSNHLLIYLLRWFVIYRIPFPIQFMILNVSHKKPTVSLMDKCYITRADNGWWNCDEEELSFVFICCSFCEGKLFFA